MSSLYGGSRCVFLMQLYAASTQKDFTFVNYVAVRAIDKEIASFVICI